MTLGWVEAQRGFDRTGLAGNTLHRSCFNTMVIALIILITTIILSVKSVINTSITNSTNVSYAAIILIILRELEWPAIICIDPVPPNCHRLNSIDCDCCHIQNKLAPGSPGCENGLVNKKMIVDCVLVTKGIT